MHLWLPSGCDLTLIPTPLLQDPEVSSGVHTKLRPEEATSALRDMLAAAGLPMGLDRAQMLEENLTLKQRLVAAEQQAESSHQVDGRLTSLLGKQRHAPDG